MVLGFVWLLVFAGLFGRTRYPPGMLANTPAAAPITGSATCLEAQTKSAWVAADAGESVLAGKTLSLEGHLSPNAASRRTSAPAIFPKLCQTKRFVSVK